MQFLSGFYKARTVTAAHWKPFPRGFGARATYTTGGARRHTDAEANPRSVDSLASNENGGSEAIMERQRTIQRALAFF